MSVVICFHLTSTVTSYLSLSFIIKSAFDVIPVISGDILNKSLSCFVQPTHDCCLTFLLYFFVFLDVSILMRCI